MLRSLGESSATARAWPRRTAWWALLCAVLIGHALMSLWLRENLAGWGAGDAPMPQRIEVAYVNALAPAAPPAPPAVAAASPRPRPGKPRAPQLPASAPAPAEPVPEPVAVEPPVPESAALTPSAPEPAPLPAAPEVVAEAPPAPALAPSPSASAAEAIQVPFEWPPSTRLAYVLKGNYRGEVHGNAQVQWVRAGSRYQVHLDIAIGPSFAPLVSRRMTSDGELGPQGLVPQRYDEATRVLFQQPRRVSLAFTPAQVTLANGSLQEALPGVQDTASQFVQLTWLFTTQPAILRVGNTVEMPLALPRRVGRWVYDVIAQERLSTPVGELDTFHLKPRLGERRPGNELAAEVWFAPSLQYLPVRLRIQQDAETFIDLMIDSAPMQAAPTPAPR